MEESFEYFLDASAITSDAKKKATLLHLIGPEVQEIFDTLTPASESYESTLNALDQHISVQKNIPFERNVFHQCKQRHSIYSYLLFLFHSLLILHSFNCK